jgi:mannose-6-phosphate isomerase-like protein (cupin superfamily)
MNATIIPAERLRDLASSPGNHPLLRLPSGALWMNAVVKVPGTPAQAEVHDEEVDLYFVLEGEGEVRLGGSLVARRTTAPGQHRGDGLQGAELRIMRAGDVVLIPAGTAHQVDALPPRLVYAVVKAACR